jgi:hypothetical protein
MWKWSWSSLKQHPSVSLEEMRKTWEHSWICGIQTGIRSKVLPNTRQCANHPVVTFVNYNFSHVSFVKYFSLTQFAAYFKKIVLMTPSPCVRCGTQSCVDSVYQGMYNQLVYKKRHLLLNWLLWFFGRWLSTFSSKVNLQFESHDFGIGISVMEVPNLNFALDNILTDWGVFSFFPQPVEANGGINGAPLLFNFPCWRQYVPLKLLPDHTASHPCL